MRLSSRETRTANKNEPQRYEGVETRVQFFGFTLLCAMAILCLQLWQLQVLNLSEFAKLAEHNRVWQKRLSSDRGLIYAANGVMLADNRASADVVFIPGECPEERREAVCRQFQEIIGIDADALYKRVQDLRRQPFTQIIVKRDLTKADRVRVEEHSHELPGATIVVHPQRRYHHGEVAGQLLGYLGEINQNELDMWKDQGYAMGDLAGKDGLERQYENMLHGQDGYMLVTKYASGQPQLLTDKSGQPYIAQRDSSGHLLNVEASPVLPKAGQPLHLTLDLDLQRKCEEILGANTGSIVVLNADTGAVLAMASTPSYDPSIFVTRGHDAERIELLRGTKPNKMIHRAFREVYPPGSVFKVLLAAAALEEGVITPSTTFFCPGHFELEGGGRRWRCWKPSGHGSVNVVDALAYSCDVFFYNVGLKLGVDRISKYGHAVGLGEKTGIDLPGETTGVLPDREWKERVFAGKNPWEKKWYPGETVNLSIGQGSMASTPLQNAALMATIVNGGYRIQPHLWEGLGPQKKERVFSDATIATVIAGMRKCVEDGSPPPTGTGNAAHIEGFTILGKTGSAQVLAREFQTKYKNEEDIPYFMRDHAWFVAGVTDHEPKIAICILMEHGHHGSSAAAPLAKPLIEYFYSRPAPTPVNEEPAEEPGTEEADMGSPDTRE